jgi:hypothetical protein
MYRLQVYVNKKWVWGLNDYETHEAAIKRLTQMKAVGIKARVRPLADLLK